ncbi:O-antigen ligase family protein [Bowmanella yangjiangensis]|uniref:O-antigen ligase family protein n=1 Tax=Bowmanella yangjiangensis TaxID=2811230 RepID=A0ABS3CSX3_9ALTE|nr:O-antigen ligase family protein [Bowmanella yangjiangensis]MBN7820222.1 O-antigen ligase family protein [Bowmanella yangjiangensis]
MISYSDGKLKLDYYKASVFLMGLFFIYSYVGLSPFAEADFDLQLSDTGGGNFLRQFVFVLLFSLTFICFRKLGEKHDLYKIGGYIFLLFWCLASVLWAEVPGVSIRRTVLLFITSSVVFMLVSIIDKEDLLRCLAKVYLGMLVVSIVSIPLVNGAVHSNPEMFDSGLVGNWKGIYSHKNIAGPATAFGILLFSYMYMKTKNLIWGFAIFCGLVFIYFTKSKTSLALIIPSMVFGIAMMKASSNFTIRKVLSLMLFIFIVLSIILQGFIVDGFVELLDDPEAFTGRATIWNIMYYALKDNFLLGLGYGSVWRVGDNMLITEYAFGWVDWVFTLTQGHNSYLDILLSIGVVGFGISIFVLFIQPFYKMIVFGSNSSFSFVYYSLFFFFVFHSFLETNLLYADKGRWLFFLLIYMVVMLKSREKAGE